MKIKAILTLLVFLVGSSSLIAQSNEASFEIGIGLGEHHFTSDDDAREGQGDDKEAPVEKANFSRIFVDWFFGGDWGIGYQTLTSNVKRDLSYSDGTETSEDWKITSELFILNYVLSNSKESKWVTFAGTGSSKYNYDRSVSSSCGLDSSECVDIDATANGSALIAGLYYDYGGPGWGFRLGADYLQTDYDTPKDENGNELDADLDATGYLYHLDVKYSF